MDCRTPAAIEFRTELGFHQLDLIMTKEQSVLTKLMKVFWNKQVLGQHFVLSFIIDLYFPKHRLAIEVDEKGHKDRDKHGEIERQKSVEKEKELNCNVVKTNPDKKDFDLYIEIGRIYNHITKSLIHNISKRLSEIKFK